MERMPHTEHHLLVIVIDQVLYNLVRPYILEILVVLELTKSFTPESKVAKSYPIFLKPPDLHIYYMISTMHPNIDHADEDVRNTTVRTFSVVASALVIPCLLRPAFPQGCMSQQEVMAARHCIVQQIAIIMGYAIFPRLRNLVQCVAHGSADKRQKFRMMTVSWVHRMVLD
jgi:splicing factor 3B subunit 1